MPRLFKRRRFLGIFDKVLFIWQRGSQTVRTNVCSQCCPTKNNVTRRDSSLIIPAILPTRHRATNLTSSRKTVTFPDTHDIHQAHMVSYPVILTIHQRGGQQIRNENARARTTSASVLSPHPTFVRPQAPPRYVHPRSFSLPQLQPWRPSSASTTP